MTEQLLVSSILDNAPRYTFPTNLPSDLLGAFERDKAARVSEVRRLVSEGMKQIYARKAAFDQSRRQTAASVAEEFHPPRIDATTSETTPDMPHQAAQNSQLKLALEQVQAKLLRQIHELEKERKTILHKITLVSKDLDTLSVNPSASAVLVSSTNGPDESIDVVLGRIRKAVADLKKSIGRIEQESQL
eukprot:ANDGO_00527.mRNA.1 hypothetical protein